MNFFVAGIVTYNPKMYRLKENILAILPQVSHLLLVDNGSKNFFEIQQLFHNVDKISILSNEVNLGIAKALNQIMLFAKRKQCQWALTLDQDSISPDNLIYELSKYTTMEQCAMISPVILDRNRPEIQEQISVPYVEVEECITSGTLTNVYAIESAGWFNETMFIDEVDSEMCYRLRLCGYQILKVSSTVLNHELGNLTPYYLFPRLGNLLNIDYFMRPKYSTNHSNFRKYYITRNNIFVLRKYRKTNAFHWKLKKKRFMKTVVLWSILEPFSVEKWKSTLQGVIDGFRMKIN